MAVFAFLRKKAKPEVFLYFSAAAHEQDPSHTSLYIATTGARVYTNATADAVMGLGEIILNRPYPNDHDDYRIVGCSKNGLISQSVHEKKTMDDMVRRIESRGLKMESGPWHKRFIRRFG